MLIKWLRPLFSNEPSQPGVMDLKFDEDKIVFHQENLHFYMKIRGVKTDKDNGDKSPLLIKNVAVITSASSLGYKSLLSKAIDGHRKNPAIIARRAGTDGGFIEEHEVQADAPMFFSGYVDMNHRFQRASLKTALEITCFEVHQ